MTDSLTSEIHALDLAKNNTAVAPLWLKSYVETNRKFPMAPAATDTAVGNSVVQSILVGQNTISTFANSEFTPTQVDSLNLIVANEHRNSNINSVPETLSKEGDKTFSSDRFNLGWNNIKHRVLLAITSYVGKCAPDLEVNIPEPENALNLQSLNEFFKNPKYEIQKDALCNLYAAASSVLSGEEVGNLGAKQRNEYSDGKINKFQVTKPLVTLIQKIDEATSVEWSKRYSGKISDDTRKVFVDIITRRNDQPVE